MQKVDKIKALHDSFLKVAGNYTKPHYDYEPLLADTALDFTSNLASKFHTLRASLQPDDYPPYQVPKDADGKDVDFPKSLSHAFAKAGNSNADALGTNEPLGMCFCSIAPVLIIILILPIGAALKKFAATHEKIGDARLRLVNIYFFYFKFNFLFDCIQDAAATSKFVQPYNTTLNQTIAHAMKARRAVAAIRLNYDAARAKLKTARPDREEALRAEMEAVEDEFVAVVDDAMGKMTLVVESPEPLKNLADLVAAQLAYFKVLFYMSFFFAH